MSNNSAKHRQISSPCIRQCTLTPEDICLGCYRSLTEICAWSQMTNAQKADVLIETAQRKAKR